LDEKQFSAIVDKLDKIVKLLVSESVKGLPREQDKIEALDRLDFRPGEIAKMLNKSPENVSVVLGNIRKKKTPQPAGSTGQPVEQQTTNTSQEVLT
jgi:hypothetical protein